MGYRLKQKRPPSALPPSRSESIAILLGGALLLAGGLAAVGGGRMGMSVPDMTAPDVAAPAAVDAPADLSQKNAGAGGLAVCVRLCDGFFFPSATSSGGDEACAAQCPDAPTARYTVPAGSDRIEDAVSTHGALYSALPAAKRYQSTLDSACLCRRSPAPGYSSSSLSDPTLRKGDVVMTPEGFVVFEGAKAPSNTSSNFVALSQARSLPEALRATLIDMERAGASQRRGGADATPSVSAPQSPALTPLASAAPLK